MGQKKPVLQDRLEAKHHKAQTQRTREETWDALRKTGTATHTGDILLGTCRASLAAKGSRALVHIENKRKETKKMSQLIASRLT